MADSGRYINYKRGIKMSKLFAAIFAALFALGTVSVFAADAKKEEAKKEEAKKDDKKAADKK